MPTFEVDVGNQTYEVDAPNEDIAWKWANQAHQEYLSTPTSTWEDVKGGLARTAGTLSSGVGLLQEALAATHHDPESLKQTQDQVAMRRKYWEDADPTRGRDQGAGKITSALVGLPMYLSGLGAATMMAGSTAETGKQFIDDGGSTEGALKAAGTDLALQGAAFGIPAGFAIGRGKSALAGAGINMGQEAGSHAIQNVYRGNEGIKELPEMDRYDYISAALPGAAFGAAFGRKPGSANLEPTTPRPETEQPDLGRQEPLIAQEPTTGKLLGDQPLRKPFEDIGGRAEPTAFEKYPDEIVAAEREEPTGEVPQELRNDGTTGALLGNQELPTHGKYPEGYTGPESQGHLLGDETTKTNVDLTVEKPTEGGLLGKQPEDTLASKYPEGYGETRSNKDVGSLLGGKLDPVRHDPKASPDQVTATVRQQVEQSGDIKTALESVSGLKNHESPDTAILGHIADKVLGNSKLLNTAFHRVKELYNKAGEAIGGGFDNVRRAIHLPDDFSVHGFMHEVVHSGVNEALIRYELGDRGNLSLHERIAAKNIVDLYNNIKGRKDLPDAIKAVITNSREFAAYGMTDAGFIKYLQGIKYKETTAWGKFTFAIRNLFGMEGKDATAFDHLLENSGTLIDNAQGRRIPQHMMDMLNKGETFDAVKQNNNNLHNSKSGIQQLVNNMGVTVNSRPVIYGQGQTKNYTFLTKAMADLQKAGKDLPSFGLSTMRNFFARQNFAKIFEDNPLVNYTNGKITEANQLRDTTVQRIWNGSMLSKTLTSIANSGIYKDLKRAVAYDSPAAVIGRTSDSDIIMMEKVLREGWNKGWELKHNPLNPNTPNTWDTYSHTWTDSQKAFFNAVHHIAEETKVGINKSGKRDGDVGRPGFYPAVRKGNFMVLFSQRGTGLNLRVESFRSKLEADMFMKRVKNDPQFKNIDLTQLDLKKQSEERQSDFTNIKQIIDIVGNSVPGAKKDLDAYYERFVANADPLAKHQLYRENLPGYEGSRLYKSDAQNAQAFREAMHSHVEAYANSLRNGQIRNSLAPLLEANNPIKDSGKFDNTIETVQMMSDVATGRLEPWTESMDTKFKDSFDALMVKIHRSGLGKAGSALKDFATRSKTKTYDENWYPELSGVDRGMGVATRLFYIKTLTTRPGFILSQFLSSPMALRQLMKEDNVFNALASFGKGTQALLTGKLDKDQIKAVAWVVENLETFHPNFKNAFNDLGVSEKHQFGNKVFEYFSGERFASAADSLSRYWTFLAMHEHYKSKGYKDQELWRKAAQETDANMFLYGRKEQAPIFQKMGLIGSTLSPLSTFAQASLGNFVADLKHAGKTGNIAPAAITVLTSGVLGGVLGAPLVAEWELLRKMLIWADEDLKDVLPSPIDWALNGDNRYLSHGVVSASTGLDVGSSLRWNPIISGMITGNESFLSMLPVLNMGVQFAQDTANSVRYNMGGDVTDAQYRQGVLRSMPASGPYKGIVDDLLFDAPNRDFVPDASGKAATEQTGFERFATYMGTKPTDRHAVELSVRRSDEADMARNEKRQMLVNKLADAIQSGNDTSEFYERLYELEYTPKQIKKQLEEVNKNRNMPLLNRFLGGSKGYATSPDQLRKTRNYMERFGNE